MKLLPWLHDEFNGGAHLVVDVYIDKLGYEDDVVAIIDKIALRQRDGVYQSVVAAAGARQ